VALQKQPLIKQGMLHSELDEEEVSFSVGVVAFIFVPQEVVGCIDGNVFGEGIPQTR